MPIHLSKIPDVSRARSSVALFHSSSLSDKIRDAAGSGEGGEDHEPLRSPEVGSASRRLTEESTGGQVNVIATPSTAAANLPFKRLNLGSKKSKPEDHLPHLTTTSEVHQISVGHKVPTQRTAVAAGYISFSNPWLGETIKNHTLQKGDVLAVARVAGIMAAKNTSNLIPLAHNNVAIEGCSVEVILVGPSHGTLASQHGKDTSSSSVATNGKVASDIPDPILKKGIGQWGGVKILVTCESTGKTGVEMEAMSGVMGAALTIVDMCKGMDKEVSVRGVRIIGKKGGKSGAWGIFARRRKEQLKHD
ncbi:MAG: hypothetical protein Q9222_003662 [Ikaeria aurantiellina]